ncbi:MAG: S1 RNA-binding domain-containing protein [Clostridiales bacterium]
MDIGIGDIVEGKVTGITKFGAFVEIPGKKTGLVHISEVASGYVKDVNDYLKENDLVKVQVLKMDEDGKISLSIKKAATIKQPKPEYTPKPTPIFGFEDMMKKFLQDSNNRQGEVKRNKEGKKGYK